MNNTVTIAAPREHQLPILFADHRYKLVRAGRRFGKTVLGLAAAVIGHGPETTGAPLFRGIAQGVDVLWVAPDYPQARAIWREIRKRFGGVSGIELNEVERRVTITGAGSLTIRSAEAIDGIRGSKFGGVVFDEAAYLDLLYAWRDVVRPALIDLQGWAIFISTPNAGHDGNADKETPSYFNRLCEHVMSGEASEDWAHWHFTTRDNPCLSPEEVEATYAEYDPDSTQVAQELDAKLITGGAGLAFPEWNTNLHIATHEASGHVRWSASGDWGYTKPGWLGLFATTSERSLCRYEMYFKETSPFDVGYAFGKKCQSIGIPEYVALDSACWATSDGGPTVAEEIQRGLKLALQNTTPAVIAAPKGPGSRISGKMLVHEALKVRRDAKGEVPMVDGKVASWAMPKLQFHTSCVNAIRTIPKLPKDENNPEDVDTDAEDHAYDGVRYWLMSRVPFVAKDREPKRVNEHQTEGLARFMVQNEAPTQKRFQRYHG